MRVTLPTVTRRNVLTAAIALAGVPRYLFASDQWRPYARTIVIDGLGAPGNSATQPPLTPTELKDVRDSGLTCIHLTVDPTGSTESDSAYVATMQMLLRCERLIKRQSETFTRVRLAVHIKEAKKASRVGLLLGMQDGIAFEKDLERLRDLYDLGVRVVQPTYNRRNLLGDGCLEPANSGLSIAGGEAVERMNDLGILVDLSHCGQRTAMDAIRISKQPVSFTHTGCAALADHPRNRTDAELRTVADKGGVSGIYFMPYLCQGKQPTSADVIRHLEHMIDVAGEDHVAIGTDGSVSSEDVDEAFKARFAEDTRQRRDLGVAAPQEFEDSYGFATDLNTPRKLETLAQMLAVRGHPDSRIEKILGANLMRLFALVWKG